jgi:hypothetical protein
MIRKQLLNVHCGVHCTRRYGYFSLRSRYGRGSKALEQERSKQLTKELLLRVERIKVPKSSLRQSSQLMAQVPCLKRIVEHEEHAYTTHITIS